MHARTPWNASLVRLVCAASAAALLACGTVPGEARSDGTPSGDGYLASSLERELQPDTSAAERAQLVDDNTAFALELYHRLRGGAGELFFSPLSVSLALAMTHGGARGQTATQMAQALHFALPAERLHPAFNDLDLALARRGGVTDDGRDWGFRLHLVNAIWGQHDYPFDPAYLDLLALNYGAGLRLGDFVAAADSVRSEINDWVAEQTEDRIEDLLPPGSVDEDTRLVLVNAIYFKAAWASKFVAQDSNDEPFYLNDGSAVTTRTMHQQQHFAHHVGDGYTAIALPYDEYAASMLIVMPDAGSFDAFEQGLDAAALAQIRSALVDGSVILSMPRWRFTSEVLDLRPPLRAQGMVDALDPTRADFSGMIAPAAGSLERLFISRVLHKSFVEVSEGGTEAAAATAVVMADAGCAPGGDPETVTLIRLNRPFVYFILDQATGSILFMGRVLRPQGSF